MNNKIILDHTSLGEMVYMLQDSYGHEVKYPTQNYWKRRFQDQCPWAIREILLNQMAKAFQLKFQRITT
jgi:hypothetical protein